MILGWLLSFVAAGSEAGKDIFFSSRNVTESSHLLRALSIWVFSIPLLTIAVLVRGLPHIQVIFWLYVILNAALLALATWLYMRALALGPVTRTQPILAVTTVLLVITNPIMLGEPVTLSGWVGVLMVGVGIFATQYPEVKSMFRQPGVLSQLGVAAIYAVTSNLDKLGVISSDVITYSWFVSIFLALFLLIIFLISNQRQSLQISDLTKLAPGGMINSVTMLVQFSALTFLAVPYVIAIKRLSILMVSLWGYFVRRERHVNWYRLLGMILVVAGIAMILILG